MSFKSVYAINGLNLNSHKKTNKELEIEFISCTENHQHYELKFNLIHTNLNSNSASFFVNEESNDLSVIPINSDKLNLGRSDRSRFTAKINKNEIPNFKISEMSFKAFLLCDGLAAETKKFVINGKSKNEEDITEIDEDDKERYIRKTLHKIRNSKISKRKLDIRMSTYAYQILNFNLNDKKVSRIIMQVKNNNYTDIDVSKIQNIETTKTNISHVYTGFLIDDKLGFYFDSKEDKDFVLNYLNGKGDDKFIPAFSKLNLKTIQSEIKQRQLNPGLINQKSTPLCGVAVVCNLIAKYYKLEYQYLIEDLYNYAEAFFGKNNYLVLPRNSITGQNYQVGFNEKDYPKNMPQADYVLLTSIKNSENKVLSYNGLNQFGGVTLSFEILALLTKMLIVKEVDDKTSLLGLNMQEILLLIEMDNNYSQNYDCIMFIDANMLDNKINESDVRPNHWISYKGGLTHDFITQKIKFKLFTWGQGDGKEYTINQDVFMKHFYGYIKVKVK
jgi:hypothetical protein